MKPEELETPPHLRGLASEILWLIQTPGLLREGLTHAGLPVFGRAWQLRLANTLQHDIRVRRWLLDQLESMREARSASRRIGRWYEVLFGLALRALYPTVWHSLAVRGQNRTLGELDFLVQDGARGIHLEIALKFYLLPRRLGFRIRASDFRGARGHDRLHLKLQSLSARQLQILKTPEGNQLCLDKGLDPRRIDSYAWMQGLFFYPLEDQPRQLPPLIAPDHEHGLWMRKDQLWSFLAQKRGCVRFFAVCERRDWLQTDFGESWIVDGSGLESALEAMLLLMRGVAMVKVVEPVDSGFFRVRQHLLIVDDPQNETKVEW